MFISESGEIFQDNENFVQMVKS